MQPSSQDNVLTAAPDRRLAPWALGLHCLSDRAQHSRRVMPKRSHTGTWGLPGASWRDCGRALGKHTEGPQWDRHGPMVMESRPAPSPRRVTELWTVLWSPPALSVRREGSASQLAKPAHEFLFPWSQSLSVRKSHVEATRPPARQYLRSRRPGRRCRSVPAQRLQGCTGGVPRCAHCVPRPGSCGGQWVVAGEPLQTSGTTMQSEALAIRVGLRDDTRTLWLGTGVARNGWAARQRSGVFCSRVVCRGLWSGMQQQGPRPAQKPAGAPPRSGGSSCSCCGTSAWCFTASVVLRGSCQRPLPGHHADPSVG